VKKIFLYLYVFGFSFYTTDKAVFVFTVPCIYNIGLQQVRLPKKDSNNIHNQLPVCIQSYKKFTIP